MRSASATTAAPSAANASPVTKSARGMPRREPPATAERRTRRARVEALGNPTRLQIYRTLVRAGHAGLAGGQVQDADEQALDAGADRARDRSGPADGGLELAAEPPLELVEVGEGEGLDLEGGEVVVAAGSPGADGGRPDALEGGAGVVVGGEAAEGRAGLAGEVEAFEGLVGEDRGPLVLVLEVVEPAIAPQLGGEAEPEGEAGPRGLVERLVVQDGAEVQARRAGPRGHRDGDRVLGVDRGGAREKDRRRPQKGGRAAQSRGPSRTKKFTPPSSSKGAAR